LGTILSYFTFQPPGSTRGTPPIRQFGYATKPQAEARTVDPKSSRNWSCRKAGSGEAAPPQKTLATLLDEFFVQHVDKKWLQKLPSDTISRKYANLGPLVVDRLTGSALRTNRAKNSAVEALSSKAMSKTLATSQASARQKSKLPWRR
jgi:hypothetical protein